MLTDFEKKYKYLILLTLLMLGLSTNPSLSQQSTTFTRPQDNSYSLKKVFTAPFLQSRPIKKIWESGINSKKLENDLNRVIVPEQPVEQRMESVFWREYIQSEMDDWKALEQDVDENTNVLADFAESVLPAVTELTQSSIEDIDYSDLQSTNAYLSFENHREIKSQMDDWQDFIQSVGGLALIDNYYKKIMKTVNKADQETENALVDTERDFDMLDNNLTDLDTFASQPETQTSKLLDDLDQMNWLLWPADIQDLSTTIDVKPTDANLWEEVFLDEPLDTPHNSAKIQNNKADEKQRLLDLLSRALKQGNRR